MKDAQERLTKAEEDVKEDIERERLLKEIELLDSLLDPKVSRLSTDRKPDEVPDGSALASF